MSDHPTEPHSVDRTPSGSPADPPAAERGASRMPGIGRLLLRGESLVAAIGIAVAAILLCAMAGTAWWTVHVQRQQLQQRARAEARSLSRTLAETGGTMLARGELSSLRKLIAEAGRRHDLAACRIALPDGRVLADAEPSRITAHTLPDDWPEGSVPAEPQQTAQNGTLTMRIPLHLDAERAAVLTVRDGVGAGGPFWLNQGALTGVGAIGAGALLAVLLVYHFSRLRLRAMGAIREALMAIRNGETTAEALAVSPELGGEADAWNRLLRDTDQMRKRMTAERARQSLGRRRQSRSELDEACDAMPQGLILLDDRMRVRYANGAATTLLGVERTRMIGSDVRELVDDPAVRRMVDSAEQERMEQRTSAETRHGEGEEAGVLRWTLRPVRREDGGAAMVVVEDITQQRVADEARHAFIAQATHELRTPLTNIRLYIETALDEGENDAALRGRCLNVINSESRRLERIVNDMLSTAEIESGTLQARPDDVHLKDVFDELEADYNAQAREKDIELSFHLPAKLPVIQADREMLVLALHNLLSNALKYTPEGGRVQVNVRIEDGELRVEVADTGLGISEEDQQRIFEKFYRARDKRVSDMTGSGLGLALAREVMRLHGGEIEVRSEAEKGSTFTLLMPGPAEAA